MPEVPRYQINQIKRNTYKCKTKSLCSGKNNNKKSKPFCTVELGKYFIGWRLKTIRNQFAEWRKLSHSSWTTWDRISGVQHNELARYVVTLILKVIGIWIQELLNLFSQKSTTLQGSKKAFFFFSFSMLNQSLFCLYYFV